MKLLITGATGLVGRKLISLLISEGHQVHFLTTRKSAVNAIKDCKGFYWNLHTNEIDAECIKGVDKIIHLAGASVAKRWTSSYKKEIIDSRVISARLLLNLLQTKKHQVSQFVSASGVGIYKDCMTSLYNESSQEFGTGFLSNVVKQWETMADQFSTLNIKVAKLRIGVVLAKNMGALQKMKQPILYGLGASFGSGKQYMSWVHIDDLTNVFLYVVTHNLSGIYNVAADAVTNKQFTKVLAKQYSKPILLPNVPKFIMKLIFGEMHSILLESQQVTSKKIIKKGFVFQYVNLNLALQSLL